MPFLQETLAGRSDCSWKLTKHWDDGDGIPRSPVITALMTLEERCQVENLELLFGSAWRRGEDVPE